MRGALRNAALVCLVPMVLAAGPAAAQSSPLDAHALAVEAYRAGDWEGAATLWHEVLAHGEDPAVDRAAVLYDLGNCAFRRGDRLEAVGWYTAALRLRPLFEDARANLEFARAEAGLDPDDRGDLEATFGRLVGALTLAEAEWLVLAGLVLLAVAFVVEALVGGAVGRRAVGGALVFLLVGLVPWGRGLVAAQQDPWLVIAESGAAVRSEPRDEATVLRSEPAGREVERTDSIPGWIEIELEDGASGWVRAEDAFRLRRS